MHLHPMLRPILSEHRLLAAKEPLCGPTALIETHRTSELQDADYARGRGRDGSVIDPTAIVTRSRAGQSWHGLLRWVWGCPDCPHERGLHLAAAVGGDVLCCSGEGHNLGESCTCAVTTLRMERFGAWRQEPASLAYHLALQCIPGCHPPGTLLGFGAHATLVPADLLRYRRLGEIGQQLGLRWGGDWDGDHVAFEKRENDLCHFEHHAGGTLAQVQAVLAIRGGDLSWGARAPAPEASA